MTAKELCGSLCKLNILLFRVKNAYQALMKYRRRNDSRKPLSAMVKNQCSSLQHRYRCFGLQAERPSRCTSEVKLPSSIYSKHERWAVIASSSWCPLFKRGRMAAHLLRSTVILFLILIVFRLLINIRSKRTTPNKIQNAPALASTVQHHVTCTASASPQWKTNAPSTTAQQSEECCCPKAARNSSQRAQQHAHHTFSRVSVRVSP